MDPLPHEVLGELIGNGPLDFTTAGWKIWTGLAVVTTSWTGLKMALARKFDAWETTRLAVVLGVPAIILALY